LPGSIPPGRATFTRRRVQRTTPDDLILTTNDVPRETSQGWAGAPGVNNAGAMVGVGTAGAGSVVGSICTASTGAVATNSPSCRRLRSGAADVGWASPRVV